MSRLTLKQAAEMCGGRVDPRFEGVSFFGASMDTREIEPGQLFIALKGESRDGHNYATRAIAKGAAAVLAEKPLDENVPAIYVPNVLTALGDLARAARKNADLQVVGITGSVGKTTTKEMIAAVLRTTWETGKTSRNFNNNIGLPMTVLGLEDNCRMAVLEMGMNHRGEISYLTSIAQPNLAVITNIGTMHIENLGSREGILQAKLEILEGLQPGGCLIANGDDDLLWEQNGKLPVETVYFGIENDRCQVVAEQICCEDAQMRFCVRGFGSELHIQLPAEGQHLVYDALAAATVGLKMGVAPTQIEQALASFENTGMRQKIYEVDGVTIIADCYNAGPESMDAALSVLASHKCTGRRIAVLGDMLELGARSQAEHYRIGRLAAARADMIFTYGRQSERILPGALTGGMSERRMHAFQTHEELAEELRRVVEPGDVLLIKGSRGMRMEHVLEQFLQK